MESAIKVFIDLKNETIEFEKPETFLNHIDVSLIFNSAEQFNNLSFSASLTCENSSVEQSFPKNGMQYQGTSGGTLEKIYFEITQNTDYQLDINVQHDGKFFKNSLVFKTEYPCENTGWTWNGNAWQSPIAYPEDGKLYVWNNDKENWELSQNQPQ